ncbi:hypothetical protein DCO48_08640 [Pseudomonas sp. SDI]|uniref:hypothetical protein n=1 Tax=Pseudomonas sp. SDI TaxID=2170734 RepID=UPI000DE6FDE9|nr:hypothetical protein [Pseudomonas sp. SDI]PWB33715.1 hypothetical protein DCO48_08640 [Pseudomonas sp. SDI]
MARDKAKDDKYFNCGQTHEAEYVAGLYPSQKIVVKNFLKTACAANTISNATHKEVYELIHNKLGLPIPPVK